MLNFGLSDSISTIWGMIFRLCSSYICLCRVWSCFVVDLVDSWLLCLKSSQRWWLILHSIETLDFVVLKWLVLLFRVLNKSNHRFSTVLKESVEIMVTDSIEVLCVLTEQRPCVDLPIVSLVILAWIWFNRISEIWDESLPRVQRYYERLPKNNVPSALHRLLLPIVKHHKLVHWFWRLLISLVFLICLMALVERAVSVMT